MALVIAVHPVWSFPWIGSCEAAGVKDSMITHRHMKVPQATCKRDGTVDPGAGAAHKGTVLENFLAYFPRRQRMNWHWAPTVLGKIGTGS